MPVTKHRPAWWTRSGPCRDGSVCPAFGLRCASAAPREPADTKWWPVSATDSSLSGGTARQSIVQAKRSVHANESQRRIIGFGMALRVPCGVGLLGLRWLLALRPAPAATVGDGAPAHIAIVNQGVQIGAAPAQRVQAAQHVVVDGDFHRAELEQVELEGLAVVGGGQEARDARDSARVALFGQREQARTGLGASLCGLCGLARPCIASGDLGIDGVLTHTYLLSSAERTASPMVGPADRARGDAFQGKVIAGRSAFELAHFVGQHPQRAIQAHAAVDAARRPGLYATTLDAAARLATADHVLPYTLKGRPQAVADIRKSSCWREAATGRFVLSRKWDRERERDRDRERKQDTALIEQCRASAPSAPSAPSPEARAASPSRSAQADLEPRLSEPCPPSRR